MHSILGRRGFRLAAATLVLLSIAAGVAYASIPDAGSLTYHACMLKGVGTIRIIDPEKQHCSAALEAEITFNQKGPAGPGGAQGAAGTDGVSPTVAQLTAGDANCPNGGAAITDAANHTAYVCNGAQGATGQPGAEGQPFSGTFTSPNGQYSISVTDDGISIASTSSATIGLDSTGIAIHTPGTIAVRGRGVDIQSQADLGLGGADSIGLNSGNDVFITGSGNLTINTGNNASWQVGRNFSVNTGSSVNMQASGTATYQSSGVTSVRASFVQVNGSSCAMAARIGDQIQGTAPGTGGPVFGSILTGSTSVCIG